MSGRRRQQYTTIQLTPFGRDSLKSKKKSPRESYEAMLRRFGLLLVFAVLLAIPVSAAFTQNFQDGTGFTGCVSGVCTYTQNVTGGNSFMFYPGILGAQTINTNPEQTSYAAVRAIGVSASGANQVFRAYDASMVQLTGCAAGSDISSNDRIEMATSGGILHWYFNGRETGSCPPAAIPANPTFVGFGSTQGFDDFTYGNAAQRVVYDMPAENQFVIKKDFINPASSGFAFAGNGTIVYTTYLPSSWSRSAIGATGGVNESIVLANVLTGTIYATHYTGSKNTSDESWDIQAALVNSNAPYGQYETYIIGETGVHSNPITYVGSGATVAFDSKTYSQQQTATITHTIAGGGYWDTGLYSYKLAILNGNTGQFVHNETIVTQTGTTTYTWTASDTQGTYYAIIMATPVGGGADIWMNFDYTQLSGYVTFTGYVNGAETNAVLSGANVSIVQGSVTVNQVTIADGNYSATGFLTGATLSINVTASGYSQYLVSLTPMIAKSIPLNFTLNSTTPTVSGLGIGGVARTGVLSGSLLTSGYGNPIEGATIVLKNTSNGEMYTKTTNMAGWYICDEGSSCILTTKRPYNVWGQKTGYSNSQNYTVITQ